jgi:hypothetical protein
MPPIAEPEANASLPAFKSRLLIVDAVRVKSVGYKGCKYRYMYMLLVRAFCFGLSEGEERKKKNEKI